MKKLFLFLVVFGFFAGNLFSQDDQMQKWMEYMTPGEPHKKMASLSGDWTFTNKMWMDPAAPPTESQGTAKFEMILGGRYFKNSYQGEIMGMPFEGIGLEGYDNAKKVYFTIWMDNMGTGTMYLEGKYDESLKAIVYTGKVFDPMIGKESEVKEIFKVIDENTCEMSMYNVVEGKDVKTMEMTMKRK